ncbi:AMP-dependent synthetase/ligase [Ramlibacter sp.]|uniref:AMP-dependent synthetase/ligase n=1 Tax=Ramlibacter sp. TaxID=1917967 RepID=UPI003D0C74F7
MNPNAKPLNAAPLQGDTLARRFWSAVTARGDRVALRQKARGIWEEVSWRDLGTSARRVAMGLASLGFAPGDTAAILSATRREWVYADWGVLSAGGVSVGIYPTDSPEQVRDILRDCDARVLFVDGEEQLDKALEVREQCPRLECIVIFGMAGLQRFEDPAAKSLAALMEAGEAHDRAHPGEFEQRLQSRRPDDLAIVAYTAGTTGAPKGALVSNRNLLAVMDQHPARQDESDDKVSYLPLAHIAERLLGSMLSVQFGSRMNFVENPDTLAANIGEIAPTVFLGVPRIWEKFHSSITMRMREATPVGRWAYDAALRVGLRMADERAAGRAPSASLRAAAWITDLLVFANLRRLMGLHRMRLAITTAAPVSPELLRWYEAIGVPIHEGWGMSETAGAGTMNLPGAVRRGGIGKSLPFVEMKLSAQGEILVRGPSVVAGYLNQPELTRRTIDAEGWLHTGDVGAVDAEGHWRIVDRMKDLIVTSGGGKVTPSGIENELKLSPYVADAVVIGDGKPFLACMVMIDHENVEAFAQEKSVPFSSFSSLCRTREVRELIEAEVARVNAKLGGAARIERFHLIEQKLGAEDEELTATLKLKRGVVERKYAEQIESMYSEA